MTTVSVTRTKHSLAPGQQANFPQGGAEIFCYSLSGADEIDIGLDDGELIPFARGLGYKQPHEKFRLKNTSGQTVEIQLLQANVAGVLDDRRELAAQVAVDGGIVTKTAPLDSEGGSIREIGNSVYNVTHATVAADSFDIITSAANTNGVYVSRISFDLQTAVPSPTICYFRTTFPQTYPLIRRDVSISEVTPFYMPVGCGLVLHLAANTNAQAVVEYRIL